MDFAKLIESFSDKEIIELKKYIDLKFLHIKNHSDIREWCEKIQPKTSLWNALIKYTHYYPNDKFKDITKEKFKSIQGNGGRRWADFEYYL